MKKVFIHLIIALLFLTCISPVDVRYPDFDALLTVEGYITTLPGPHTIGLNRTARYGRESAGSQIPEDGAYVAIRDDDGNIIRLNETFRGVYSTDEFFRAEVGKAYTLYIETKGGQIYQSTPQQVLVANELDSIFVQFRRKPSSNPLLSVTGFDVFAAINDPGDVQNFYMWRVIGTYKLRSRPDLFVPRCDGCPPGVPQPKPCCDLCYVPDNQLNYNILSDIRFNGSRFNHNVSFIPDDGRRFNDRYYLELEHMAINGEAFNHFSLVNNQLNIQGSIFDPPPATVRGNIIHITNPDLNAIGFFGAFDAKRYGFYPDLRLLVERQPINQLNDDCRVINRASVDPPPFWSEN